MARKNYPDEFKRDAVALYRDTDGATITAIAAELGVSEATLSAWCKVAGVAIRHRKPASVTRPKLRLFGQVILGLMWGFGGGGWFGSDYAAMVRGMVASMRSKARR
jgi:hypothetical protein